MYGGCNYDLWFFVKGALESLACPQKNLWSEVGEMTVFYLFEEIMFFTDLPVIKPSFMKSARGRKKRCKPESDDSDVEWTPQTERRTSTRGNCKLQKNVSHLSIFFSSPELFWSLCPSSINFIYYCYSLKTVKDIIIEHSYIYSSWLLVVPK